MKRLTVLIALVVILAGLLTLVVSDTGACTTETAIPDNEVTSSLNETDNSGSASATIMITWTTAPLPDE